MKTVISSWLLFRLLFQPTAVFEELADTQPEPHTVFFKYLVWLAVIPPLFAYIGASNFGWRLGAAMPLFIPASDLMIISILYFFTLLFGFVSMTLVPTVSETRMGVDRDEDGFFDGDERDAGSDPADPMSTPDKVGDLDGDGVVGPLDLAILLEAWGPCGLGKCHADLDHDATVGVTDLLIMLSNWG